MPDLEAEAVQPDVILEVPPHAREVDDGAEAKVRQDENSRMTRDTRMMDSRSVWNTSLTDSRMNGVVS